MYRYATVFFAICFTFAGCGEIGSKPSEPVEGGGSTSPGIGFPGTNSAPNGETNNGSTNNDSANNVVIVANNQSNSSVGNSGNVEPNSGVNSTTRCSELPDTPETVGFSTVPTDTSGFVSSVSPDQLVIELENGGQATFNSIGFDLTTYFGVEESVNIIDASSGTETTITVGGPSGFVEHLTVKSEGVDQSNLLTARSQFGVEIEQLEGSAERCQVEGECGLQERVLGTPDLLMIADGSEIVATPGSTVRVPLDGIELDARVINSQVDIVSPLSAEGCDAEGSGTAEISVLFGTTAG